MIVDHCVCWGGVCDQRAAFRPDWRVFVRGGYIPRCSVGDPIAPLLDVSKLNHCTPRCAYLVAIIFINHINIKINIIFILYYFHSAPRRNIPHPLLRYPRRAPDRPPNVPSHDAGPQDGQARESAVYHSARWLVWLTAVMCEADCD